MASIYLGLNRGADSSPDQVTEQGTDPGSDVVLRIDTGQSLTRAEVTRISLRLTEALNDGRSAYFPL